MMASALFTTYDNRPCVPASQCEDDSSVAQFVKRYRDSFVYSVAWDAFFLVGEVPKNLTEAMRGEDDGLLALNLDEEREPDV